MARTNILTQINQDAEISEGFISKIVIAEDGCWLFRNKRGFVSTYTHPKALPGPIRPHRFSYELYRGQIPKGMHVDHLCMEKGCCNPDHLEVVTPKENVIRYHKAKREGKTILGNDSPTYRSKTHCRNGHEYNEVGYYSYHGIRACSLCRRLRSKESKKRKKEWLAQIS